MGDSGSKLRCALFPYTQRVVWARSKSFQPTHYGVDPALFLASPGHVWLGGSFRFGINSKRVLASVTTSSTIRQHQHSCKISPEVKVSYCYLKQHFTILIKVWKGTISFWRCQKRMQKHWFCDVFRNFYCKISFW